MMFEINSRRPVRKKIPLKPNPGTKYPEQAVLKVFHTYVYNSVAHILWDVKGYA